MQIFGYLDCPAGETVGAPVRVMDAEGIHCLAFGTITEVRNLGYNARGRWISATKVYARVRACEQGIPTGPRRNGSGYGHGMAFRAGRP